MFERFLKDESGATAIEYALIASATGLALIAVMPSLNIVLSAKFAAINNGLQ